MRYVVFSTATALTACVTKANNHAKHPGYNKSYQNNSGANNPSNNSKSISERAQNADLKRIEPDSRIQQILGLNPGWLEVILLNPATGSKADCTVDRQGHIGYWVNLKSAH